MGTLFSEIHIITSRMGSTKTCVVVVVALLALFRTFNAEELGKDPCATKDDGVHATKDVFQYMICKNKRASYHSCGNKLFDPCKKRCVSAWEVSPKTLCKCRENGNSMHPWSPAASQVFGFCTTSRITDKEV